VNEFISITQILDWSFSASFACSNSIAQSNGPGQIPAIEAGKALKCYFFASNGQCQATLGPAVYTRIAAVETKNGRYPGGEAFSSR
jgi:hypothetical protein